MRLFIHGLGPPFREVEAKLAEYGILVHLLGMIPAVSGVGFVPAFRLFRQADGRAYPIQHFDPETRVGEQLLWDWCEFFEINAGDAFRIYRL